MRLMELSRLVRIDEKQKEPIYTLALICLDLEWKRVRVKKNYLLCGVLIGGCDAEKY
jgi:hypothetical protein